MNRLLFSRALQLTTQGRTQIDWTRFTPRRLVSSASNKEVGEQREQEEHRAAEVREQNVIQIKEPPIIEPIRHELINRISTEYHGVQASQFNDQFEWYPIFRSPYVNAMRYVIKFKVYLTAFSFLSSIIYTSQIFLGATANPWKAAILSTVTLAGLVFVGDYARRLVVQIYVSKDLQYVRFCRLSFFGTRKDMILPRDCIVRLTEINPTQRAPILNIKFMMPEKGIDLEYDNYEFYELGFRLPLGLGGVLDRDRFNLALGKILVKKPE